MAGTKDHKPLSDTKLRNLKFDAEKGGASQFYADGGGLSIKITPNNTRTWVFSYRLNGKQSHMAIGLYPDLTLEKARDKRQELKSLIAQGIDPKEHLAQKEIEASQNDTLENIALKWLEHSKDELRDSTYVNYIQVLNKHVFPILAQKHIKDIIKRDLVEVCEQSKKYGPTVPNKVANILKQIFEYAEDSGIIEINPATSLTRLFKKVKAKEGFAAQTDIESIAINLRKIKAYCENSRTLLDQHKLALQVLPYTGLRVTALCQLKWENIDFETGKVNIEAIEGNKTKVGFSVYFGQRTLQLFKEYKELGLSSTYVFPAVKQVKNPFISHNTIAIKLQAAGIDNELQTPHGFRKCLKTLLMTINPSERMNFFSERALGHKRDSYLELVYNKADYETYWKDFWQYCEDLLIAIRDNQTLPECPF